MLEERHWPEAIPRWWKSGGSEVCSHPRHVNISCSVRGGRIWLRRGQVPRWRLSACLHPCWQSGTRKVCIRGKCAQGDFTAAVAISDRLDAALSSVQSPKPVQSQWVLLQWLRETGRDVKQNFSCGQTNVCNDKNIRFNSVLIWWCRLWSKDGEKYWRVGCSLGEKEGGSLPNHCALEAANGASGGNLVCAACLG